MTLDTLTSSVNNVSFHCPIALVKNIQQRKKLTIHVESIKAPETSARVQTTESQKKYVETLPQSKHVHMSEDEKCVMQTRKDDMASDAWSS